MTRYQHTQFGWAIGISTLIPAAILTTVAVTGSTLGPVLALIPLLGWLTVDVTDDAVGLRFGVGAIRKRVRLDEIDSIAPVIRSG